MDTLQEDPEVLSTSLLSHFSTLSSDPVTHTLDTDLCQRTSRSLTSSTPSPLLLSLLSSGEALLLTLSQTNANIEPLTRLLQRTIVLLPLDELLPLLPPTKLIAGLTSGNPPIQVLCLAYLTKLASSPSGAAFVASSADLTDTLLMVWLGTPSTEVAERSLESIIALLEIDTPPASSFPSPTTTSNNRSSTDYHSTSTPGANTPLLWRRLFLTPSTYTIFFSQTTPTRSLSTQVTAGITPKQFNHKSTTAQARLMDFLTRLSGLNLASITTSFISEVEDKFTLTSSSPTNPYHGLLRYVSGVISSSNDLLMSTLYSEFAANVLRVLLGDEEDDGGRIAVPSNVAAAAAAVLPSSSTPATELLITALKQDAGDTYRPAGPGMNGAGGAGLHL